MSLIDKMKNAECLGQKHYTKLDFGCGKRPKRGFVGVDIRKSKHVELVCNAWEIVNLVSPGTVAEIYSRHFFEHLTFAQADKTLKAWRKILVSGGIVQVIVPDIRYHIAQFLSPNPFAPSEASSGWTLRVHALAGFWGWQREGDTKFWDVHKSGYDFESLKTKLLENGFCDVQQIEDKPWHLNVMCNKP